MPWIRLEPLDITGESEVFLVSWSCDCPSDTYICSQFHGFWVEAVSEHPGPLQDTRTKLNVSENRITNWILGILQAKSDVFEWKTIDYLCECLFCNFRRQQVRNSSSKDALMVCVENIAHATAVQVLGGRSSGPLGVFRLPLVT